MYSLQMINRIEVPHQSKLSKHASSIMNCCSILIIWLLKTVITNALENEVKHEVHKEAKSEAESSDLDHIIHITNVKAFIHPQLLSQKDH